MSASVVWRLVATVGSMFLVVIVLVLPAVAQEVGDGCEETATAESETGVACPSQETAGGGGPTSAGGGGTGAVGGAPTRIDAGVGVVVPAAAGGAPAVYVGAAAAAAAAIALAARRR